MTTDFPSPRRQFLLGLGCLGAAAAGARPAAAFQTLPSGDYAALVDQSCGVTAAHRRLLDEARARLGPALPDDQVNAALAGLRCPICGCPLATAALSDTPESSGASSPATEANRHE